VTRYAPDYPGLLGRNLTPGFPIEPYKQLPTGVTERTSLPARPRLSISPNPFHGSVSITLDHSISGALDHSAVRIFDASGRLVRLLTMPSSLAPSPSSLSWDGRDASGRLCPPGVHICHLTAPSASTTAKILLAK
jgi:hypothetical protein